MKATISKVLSLLVCVFLVSACGAPAVTAPPTYFEVEFGVSIATALGTEALTGAVLTTAQTGGLALAAAVVTVSIVENVDMCPPDTTYVKDLYAPGGQGICLPQHVYDGEPAKVRSRIDAAKNADGKSPSACYVREADITNNVAAAAILYFEGAYRGSSNKYSGSTFLFNITAKERSTFMGVKRPKDAQLPGFEAVPLDDQRCREAQGFMADMIAEMKTLPGWQ